MGTRKSELVRFIVVLIGAIVLLITTAAGKPNQERVTGVSAEVTEVFEVSIDLSVDVFMGEFLVCDLEIYNWSEVQVVDDSVDQDEVNLGELELSGFKSFIHYRSDNLDRYDSYSKLYSELSLDKVITYVNIGLDRPFYSDMKVVGDPSSSLVLVNKYNILPSDYVPEGFEGVSRSLKLREDAQESFDLMKFDASQVGLNLLSVSGYRSYNAQHELYERYKKQNSATVDTFSARPGSSEHQTGLAVDINTASSSVKFENTREYKWLCENAYKYGFILRYPSGKEYITGYKFEPWHWRYVGEFIASIIKEHDLTFDEYIGNSLN